MKAMTTHRILIVDDEEPMRRLIATNLRVSGYRVQTAADGIEALHLVDEHQFDLLLLDVNIPGPNGFEVVRKIRGDVGTPILMVSGRTRERDRVTALELGADDYLDKPFGVAELVARVKSLLRRVTLADSGQPPYEYAGLEVDFDARLARRHGTVVRLTRREFEVLAYLARNAGKVLLHRQILHSAWGGQYGEEAHYVWNVVQRIRSKIEPDRKTPRYILTQPGVGYRMPKPELDAELRRTAPH